MATHHPTEIKLHQQSHLLEISYNDGAQFNLRCEYLRVFSPSADVRGHFGDFANLVTGKEKVNIKNIVPVGQYAIKIFFDDGYKSGFYDWDYLYDLGLNYEEYWNDYLTRCHESGVSTTATHAVKENSSD